MQSVTEEVNKASSVGVGFILLVVSSKKSYPHAFRNQSHGTLRQDLEIPSRFSNRAPKKTQTKPNQTTDPKHFQRGQHLASLNIQDE